MRRWSECIITVDPGICIWLALMLLIVPLKWAIAIVLAASFHEFCHYLAIAAVKGHVLEFRIAAMGANMKIAPMNEGKELLCALAGPIGGLFLLALAKWIPRIAICAAVQAAYNLIPVYPLDGGRALRCAAMMLFPIDRAETVCAWVERISLCGIFSIAIYGSVWAKLGCFPLVLFLFLAFKTKYRKIPCKAAT